MFLYIASHLLADDPLPADPHSLAIEPQPMPPIVVRKGYCRHCGKRVGAKVFLKSHEAICEARE